MSAFQPDHTVIHSVFALQQDHIDGRSVIDVDENPNLARNFGVMSVPTLYLFKDGKEISKQNGFMSKEELSDWINNND